MPPERDLAAGGQRAFAAALASGATLAGLHDGRGRPAADRLDVYRNNVVVSLRDALRTTFTATARLMGETYFEAAAVAYARAHKPASPLLFRYGDGFADHLSDLPGLANYPFVPEAARIEYARVTAYHALDAAPLRPDALEAIAADALPAATFVAHPAAAVLRLPNGGLGAWQENSGRAREPAPACLVTRPAMEVDVRPLDAAAARFAHALLGGAPLGEAAGDPALDLAGTLGLLLSAGAFAGLGQPPPAQ